MNPITYVSRLCSQYMDLMRREDDSWKEECKKTRERHRGETDDGLKRVGLTRKDLGMGEDISEESIYEVDRRYLRDVHRRYLRSAIRGSPREINNTFEYTGVGPDSYLLELANYMSSDGCHEDAPELIGLAIGDYEKRWCGKWEG